MRFQDRSFDYRKVNEDPIAWGDDDEVRDANLPIWDPREYFLRMFKSRIAQVLKEWKNLISRVERTIEEDLDVCSPLRLMSLFLYEMCCR